ncbi:MAG: galactokinase [Anaerolineae bacterium]
MVTVSAISSFLHADSARPTLTTLYGSDPATHARQIARYDALLERFSALFPAHQDVRLFSTPGRTEVGGNHTDHNAGRVLAAAVDLDVIAAASANDEGVIRLHSEGYPISTVRIDELAPVAQERYTSSALIRGVCARMRELGCSIGGFDVYSTTNVLKGSGLSSSAAFEVLMVTILSYLYNEGRVDPVLAAKIAQYAENNYFGKPCGLMDQTTCSVGGFVTIDLQDFANPLVKKVDFDLSASGYALIIVDTGGNHADLNEDYASLEREMKDVARALGGRVLREFSKERLLAELPRLHGQVSDRAILRALHFYADDQRVVEQVACLEQGDLARFLELVTASGRSSWTLAQNCYSCKSVHEQGIPLALAVSAEILGSRGAWRVHGGGFAGTAQAFVPADLVEPYEAAMRGIFGEGSCHRLMIRPVGAVEITPEG